MTKTDNPNDVGIHAFEKAGLGKAPFRCTGYYEDRGPKRVIVDGVEHQYGSPGQPMGTCDYCGTGIALCCTVRSADGKTFVVGSDCVNKTGDKGLIQAYKRSPEYRERQRQMRHAREQRTIKEMKQWIEENQELLRSKPAPYKWEADRGNTYLDHVNWQMANCGNSGRIKLWRRLKKAFLEN